MNGLRSRMKTIEQRIGTDDARRHIMIWVGPHLEESWIEWDHGRNGDTVSLYVKTPTREADPWHHLTEEQRVLIRPEDSIVVTEMSGNTRHRHLELNTPPWKRKTRSLPSSTDAINLNGSIGLCDSTDGSF
jgi:hypothetical protein